MERRLSSSPGQLRKFRFRSGKSIGQDDRVCRRYGWTSSPTQGWHQVLSPTQCTWIFLRLPATSFPSSSAQHPSPTCLNSLTLGSLLSSFREGTKSYYSWYPVMTTTSVPRASSVQCVCSLNEWKKNSEWMSSWLTLPGHFSSCSDELLTSLPPSSLWAPWETILVIFTSLCLEQCYAQVGT